MLRQKIFHISPYDWAVEEKFIVRVYGDPNGITALFEIHGTSKHSSLCLCMELLVWTWFAFWWTYKVVIFFDCRWNPEWIHGLHYLQFTIFKSLWTFVFKFSGSCLSGPWRILLDTYRTHCVTQLRSQPSELSSLTYWRARGELDVNVVYRCRGGTNKWSFVYCHAVGMFQWIT
jgi:hypothetical protein